MIWLRLVGLPGMFASLFVGFLTSRLGTAGVAGLAIPAMITLFGETAAPNRAGGMALNGFVLFVGAGIGPLTTRLGLFPVLVFGLAGLTLSAVLSLTAFARMAHGSQGQA